MTTQFNNNFDGHNSVLLRGNVDPQYLHCKIYMRRSCFACQVRCAVETAGPRRKDADHETGTESITNNHVLLSYFPKEMCREPNRVVENHEERRPVIAKLNDVTEGRRLWATLDTSLESARKFILGSNQ